MIERGGRDEDLRFLFIICLLFNFSLNLRDAESDDEEDDVVVESC